MKMETEYEIVEESKAEARRRISKLGYVLIPKSGIRVGNGEVLPGNRLAKVVFESPDSSMLNIKIGDKTYTVGSDEVQKILVIKEAARVIGVRPELLAEWDRKSYPGIAYWADPPCYGLSCRWRYFTVEIIELLKGVKGSFAKLREARNRINQLREAVA